MANQKTDPDIADMSRRGVLARRGKYRGNSHKKKIPGAVKLGVLGGHAKAANMTAEERSEHARHMRSFQPSPEEMCPCGRCGLSLERAMGRHPGRVLASAPKGQLPRLRKMLKSDHDPVAREREDWP